MTLPLEIWQAILWHCDDTTFWILLQSIEGLQTLVETSRSFRTAIYRRFVTKQYYLGFIQFEFLGKPLFHVEGFAFLTHHMPVAGYTLSLFHFGTEHPHFVIAPSVHDDEDLLEQRMDHLRHIGHVMMKENCFRSDLFVANFKFGLFFDHSEIMSSLERKKRMLAARKFIASNKLCQDTDCQSRKELCLTKLIDVCYTPPQVYNSSS